MTTTNIKAEAVSIPSDAATILEAGRQLGGASSILQRTNGGIPFTILPSGVAMKFDIGLLQLEDERAEKPRELQGTATLMDEASLIAHILRNKDQHSALFADSKSLRAVYDYNLPVAGPDVRSASARWRRHSAIYTPTLSAEWTTWVAGSGKMMGQAEFADFLEINDLNIAGPIEGRSVPSPADLMTLANTLKVTVSDVIESTINRNTGEYSLIAKSEQQQVGSAKIPKEFDIEIPVFENGPLHRLVCKFRFRKEGSACKFGWVVPGADRMLREARQTLAKRVADATKLPLFMGSPES